MSMGENRLKRHELIMQLVRDHRIKTQEEIVAMLNERGHRVTQATVSRDIKELNLFKATASNGESYYCWTTFGKQEVPTTITANPDVFEEREKPDLKYKRKVEKIFKETVIKIESAYFLIVISTLPGMAQAAAHAIDTLGWDSIVGTIAGDDTIFVALKREQDVMEVMRAFEELMK